MRRAIFAAILLLLGGLLAPPASAETKPVDLVKAAVKAMGGAKAMHALKSLNITAEATHWEPEQSFIPDGEARLVGTSHLRILWDLANERSRTDWERTLVYPFPGAPKFSDVVTPSFGYVADEKGDQPMSARRLAVQWREQERASPLLLLRALYHPEKLRRRRGTRSTVNPSPPCVSSMAARTSSSFSTPRRTCRSPSARSTTA